MSGIGLVTDSNAQLPPELVERYGVEVVPLTVVVDGVEYREGVDLDADGFYERFEHGTPEVSTSQPGPGLFAGAYRRLAERGAEEILSVHVTEGLSGTLNSARLAGASSPVPVRLVDSGTGSFGVSCCLWEAAEAIRAGADLDGAAAVAESVAATVGTVFVVQALELARRGGRLDVRVTGHDRIPVVTARGAEVEVVDLVADLDEAVTVMAEFALGWGDHLRIAVGIADRQAAVVSEALVDHLRGRERVDDLVRYRVGPSVGAHTGPGTAGAFFYPAR